LSTRRFAQRAILRAELIGQIVGLLLFFCDCRPLITGEFIELIQRIFAAWSISDDAFKIDDSDRRAAACLHQEHSGYQCGHRHQCRFLHSFPPSC
jgi:hypothetical protein